MDSAVIGALSALGGVAVAKMYDAVAENGRRKREDVVWRREHALQASADFIQLVGHIHHVGRNITSAKDFLEKAKQSGSVQSVEYWTQTLLDCQQDKMTALTQASNALSRLSLLLQQETYLAASTYFEVVSLHPHDPTIGGLSAHVNNLLRADIGLPARVIADGEGITMEEYQRRIAATRAQRPPGVRDDDT